MPNGGSSHSALLDAQRSVRQQFELLRSLPSRSSHSGALSTRRPGDPAQLAALAALCRQKIGVELPVDYRAWMEEFDGFDIVCASGSPMQIHGALSALLLYNGQGTLEPEYLEIGGDNGGWLYTVDLINSWGKGTGAIWLVPMSDPPVWEGPNEPFFCAPTLTGTIDCLVRGVDFIVVSHAVPPADGHAVS